MVLKPNFVFFGEGVPESVRTNFFVKTIKFNIFILIGTTGEIMSAFLILYKAKKNYKRIIGINIQPSAYTNIITNIFL